MAKISRSSSQSSGLPAPKWHELDSKAVAELLRSDVVDGLTGAEATRRLREYGRNELQTRGSRRAWLILWEQLTALMVLILLAAASVSLLLGDFSDAIAIGAIILLNVLLGFTQEYRAEKALFALKKLAVPRVRARREAQIVEGPSTRVVPGDIVLLESGNLVPADCRVIESVNLQTQEAALTGESQAVRKRTEAIADREAPLGDRHNMVYMGTFVASGRGQAMVTETGMHTELGHIAEMIHDVNQKPTPLQLRLNQLAMLVAIVALGIVALIFVLGLLQGEPLKLMFLAAVSIGVAAVPEGLPAVVTIALTLGAQRMLKRKALIRKLSAVEALGSVSVICSDKTGTLTENRMAVAILQLVDDAVHVRHSNTFENGRRADEIKHSGVGLLLAGGMLCNDAVMQSSPDIPNAPVTVGDPTEAALLVAAAQYGLVKAVVEKILPRVAEYPFSSERKRMTTVHSIPPDISLIPLSVRASLKGGAPSFLSFTKGSVETVLPLCSKAWVNDNAETLDDAAIKRLLDANDTLARNGMRILGVAFRYIDSLPPGAGDREIEQQLTFVGMIGMIDPARRDVGTAVAICKKAGIRPVMVTGDHPLTARYIATELGIMTAEPYVTGSQIDHISDLEMQRQAETVSVYARVSPEHKLKIIESLQRSGHIVAMTGDGVNDAPALKKANVGVAMGLSGTDVAKEAADVVLLDDNFATIVAAVEEGRVIYDNLRKFVKYILATNSGEIWVMIAAPFLGMPLALLPLQILWMNLMTDGLPALALSAEPSESDTMQRPPRAPSESIFAQGMGLHVVWVGLLMGILSLGVGYGYWKARDPKWQTMIFTTLTLCQMAHVLAIRSERRSLFQIGVFSNKPLIAAVSLTVMLQLTLLSVPLLQKVFNTKPLSAADLICTVGLAALIFCAVELEKWFRRGRALNYLES